MTLCKATSVFLYFIKTQKFKLEYFASPIVIETFNIFWLLDMVQAYMYALPFLLLSISRSNNDSLIMNIHYLEWKPRFIQFLSFGV